MAARIQVTSPVRKGDLIEVRLLIQHPMETGYRVNESGANIPRNVIRNLSVRYDGAEVFRAETSSGIAANPYFQFTTVATVSGEMEFSWIDDAGVRETERRAITVSS